MHAKLFLMALLSGLAAAAAIERRSETGCAADEVGLSAGFTHNDEDDSPLNGCKIYLARTFVGHRPILSLFPFPTGHSNASKKQK
jgi:hypothetical protein